MFIKKKNISTLLKKERQKEKKLSEKYYTQKYKKEMKKIIEAHERELKEIIQESNEQLRQKNWEIQLLKNEIEKNHSKYIEIRQKEKHVDLLSREIDDVVNDMIIKVQESVQPFYRTRAKVERTKRKSDKSHNKVQSIFEAVK